MRTVADTNVISALWFQEPAAHAMFHADRLLTLYKGRHALVCPKLLLEAS
jgi:predicted nucleic acid-binding protein